VPRAKPVARLVPWHEMRRQLCPVKASAAAPRPARSYAAPFWQFYDAHDGVNRQGCISAPLGIQSGDDECKNRGRRPSQCKLGPSDHVGFEAPRWSNGEYGTACLPQLRRHVPGSMCKVRDAPRRSQKLGRCRNGHPEVARRDGI